MQTRKSGILALVAGALVLGACEQKAPIVNIPQPTNPVTVAIAGAPTNAIKKGTTVQLIAVVSNTTNQAVTWSVLSGATVASVSSTGLVTALLPGTAVVQAVSQADPTAKAAVAITVADTATTGGGTVGQPSLTIGSVTTNGPNGLNSPINYGNVAGTIDVTMNVDIPTGVKATGLQLSVKNSATGATTVITCQSFSATGSSDASVEGAQAPQTVVCSVPTAQVNATTGVPTFANGQYVITAQLLNGNTVIASANTQTMVFNNVDALTTAVSVSGTNSRGGTGSAADAGGLVWKAGDLTVTVTPTIFSGTTGAVSRVTIQLYNATTCAAVAGAKTVTTAAANGSYSFTFSSSDATDAANVVDVEAPLVIGVNSVNAAGNAGPTIAAPVGCPLAANAAAVRLDNARPTITAQPVIAANTWWGANTTYTAMKGGITTADGGVDNNTTTVQYAPTGTTSFTSFTAAADIPETVTATWDIRVRVCDALGNCRNSAVVGPVGVDRTAPTAAFDATGEQNHDINAGTAFVIAITEDRSGVTGTPLMTVITRSYPGLTTAQKCYVGALDANNVCQPIATAQNIPYPGAGNPGYYTITTYAVDIAGNKSATITEQILIDGTAPAVGVIGSPLSITGGQPATFTAALTDDLDLLKGDVYVNYGCAGCSFFAATSTVGAAFDGTNTTSATASATVNSFIRALLTAPNTVGGAATGVTAIATDAAGNVSAPNTYNFQAGQVNAPTAAEFTTTAGFTLAGAPSPICSDTSKGSCTTPANGTSTTLTAQLSGATGTYANPAATVNFYVQNAAGTAWVFVGSSSAAVITDNGVNRFYTYTLSVPATSLPNKAAANNLVAVAVNSAGSGLLSNTVAVTRDN